MPYNEFIENDTDLANLHTDFIEHDDYVSAHKNTAIVCHDVFIRCEYKGTQGILLVKRLNYPVKGVYWPIGGRVLRGVTTEESLQKKVLDECSLILFRLTYLATARTFFKDEPFGHTKGTDTLNLIFIADGLGTINLNSAHTDPMIVTKDSYPTLRESFVPYVQTYLDHIDKENLW